MTDQNNNKKGAEDYTCICSPVTEPDPLCVCTPEGVTDLSCGCGPNCESKAEYTIVTSCGCGPNCD